MRLWLVLPVLALASLVAGSAAASDADQLEYNTDRPGSDYRDFDLPNGRGSDAGLKQCLIECENDGQCVAFTYVRAGVQGPSPRCWLKDQVPEAGANDCCISWVKDNGRPPAAPQRGIRLQHGVNLQGSDYRDFEMAAGATPEMCRDACQAEGQCRAFTYVKAGPRGAVPHCWLKNTVPQSYNDDQCISGVKE
jgi:hypothetical protein